MQRCLLVPTLAYDLSILDRMANSIDYPIKEKVIINNGKRGALNDWWFDHQDWFIRDTGENVGCAGAWNLAPIVFKDDMWLISNDDQIFQPGALKAIYEGIEGKENDYHIIYVNQYEAFDIFVWTRKGVNEIGLFDENFYPVYLEDYEYRMRFRVANGKKLHLSIGDNICKHGKEPKGKYYEYICQMCGLLNTRYLIDKWGSGDGENALYKTPFNDPENKITDWKLDHDLRKQRIEIIKSVQNEKELSAYL